MKYWKPIVIFLILIIGLVLAKMFFFPSPQKGNGPAGPSGPMTANVDGFVVEYSSLDNMVFATGSLIPNEIVEIKPEVSGKLIFLNIPEGQMVQKGQILARVNDADLKAQLKRLEVQIKIAENKEERARKLSEINGLSVEEYEDALNALNVLRADIDYTKTLIDKTVIKAPFAGKLGFKNVSDGSFVSTAEALTTLQQIQPIKIEFSIPERYAPQTKVGNVIQFKVDGYDQDFRATVYAIEPGIDVNSRSAVMRAKSDNPGQQLKPGAFARISLSTGNDDKAIMIPTQSVIPILKGQQVLKVVNGEVVPQKITLGYRSSDKVQVMDGLSQGDTIITTGLMSLRPGSKVNIKAITQ